MNKNSNRFLKFVEMFVMGGCDDEKRSIVSVLKVKSVKRNKTIVWTVERIRT